MIVEMIHLVAMLATFALAMGWYPCGCCGGSCNICGFSDATQWEVDVTISGMANNDPFDIVTDCFYCADLNSTFTATHVTGCIWEYVFPGTSDLAVSCDVSRIVVFLELDGTDVVLKVEVRQVLSDAVMFRWDNTISSASGTTDCTLNAVSATYDTGSGVVCDAGASSVSLSWSTAP